MIAQVDVLRAVSNILLSLTTLLVTLETLFYCSRPSTSLECERIPWSYLPFVRLIRSGYPCQFYGLSFRTWYKSQSNEGHVV